MAEADAGSASLRALELKLQIAEVEKATALAQLRTAEQAAGATPTAAEVAAVAKAYVRPRDYGDVRSARFLPQVGEGAAGEPQTLPLLGDLALAAYQSQKSQHAAWIYRRVRSGVSYLELVNAALSDLRHNAEVVDTVFALVGENVAKLKGTAEEQAAGLARLEEICAAGPEGRPTRAALELTDRIANSSAGVEDLLGEVSEFLYVKGAPAYEVPEDLRKGLLSTLLGAGEYEPRSETFVSALKTFKSHYSTQLGKAAASKLAASAAGKGQL